MIYEGLQYRRDLAPAQDTKTEGTINSFSFARIFDTNLRIYSRTDGYSTRIDGYILILTDIRHELTDIFPYRRIFSASRRLYFHTDGYSTRIDGYISVQTDIRHELTDIFPY